MNLKSLLLLENIQFDWSLLMTVVDEIETITNNSVSIHKNSIVINDYSDNYFFYIWFNEDGYGMRRYLESDFDCLYLGDKKEVINKKQALIIAIKYFIENHL